MTKPITKFDDIVEIYFESGSTRIRLKREMNRNFSRENKVNELKKDEGFYPILSESSLPRRSN